MSSFTRNQEIEDYYATFNEHFPTELTVQVNALCSHFTNIEIDYRLNFANQAS